MRKMLHVRVNCFFGVRVCENCGTIAASSNRP